MTAVVLVGHGGVPRDFPRADLQRLKALEGERRARGAEPSDEERALERKIRTWPRTPATDPYQAGLEAVAATLRPKLGAARLVVAYNEFCAPSLEDAVAELVSNGARLITVVPSMLTPGRRALGDRDPGDARRAPDGLPGLELRYAWPFDGDAVADLLALQINGRDE